MSDSVFAQYAPQPSPEQDDGRQLYTAFEMGVQGRRERRLMLFFQDGQVSVMSYSYLMEVLCTSHQFLSLIYTNCVITLKGSGLTAFLSHLQDEKVRWLQCYHPEVHRLPDGNAPIILSMKRENPKDALGAARAKE